MLQYIGIAALIVVGCIIFLYILGWIGTIIRTLLEGLSDDTTIGCIFFVVVSVIAAILYKIYGV